MQQQLLGSVQIETRCFNIEGLFRENKSIIKISNEFLCINRFDFSSICNDWWGGMQ